MRPLPGKLKPDLCRINTATGTRSTVGITHGKMILACIETGCSDKTLKKDIAIFPVILCVFKHSLRMMKQALVPFKPREWGRPVSTCSSSLRP